MKASSIMFISLLLISFSFAARSNLKSKFKQSGVSESQSVYCLLNNNGTIYDLNPLNNEQSDYTIDSADQSKMYLNFCKNSVNSCTNKTGLITYKKGDECLQLAGAEDKFSKWAISNNTETNEISILIKLPEGDVCKSNPEKRYQITEIITCDEKAENIIFGNSASEFTDDQCEYTLRMKSKHACPKLNVFSLIKQMYENKFIIGPVLVIFGIFFCMFGTKFVTIVQFLTGVVLVTGLTFYLIFVYIHIQYTALEFWLICALCVLLGLIAGYFIAQIDHLVPTILGGCLGYILGTVLYHLVFKYIKYEASVVYWSTIVSSIALLIVLACFLPTHFIIVPTAFIGAFSCMKGISIMLGGFPDERYIVQLVNNEEWEQLRTLLDYKVYLYIAFFFVMGIVGLYVQYKYFNSNDDKKNTAEKQTEEQAKLIEKK